MIQEITETIRHGEKRIIDNKPLFYNSKTNKWVVRLFKSKEGLFKGKLIGLRKGKAIGKRYRDKINFDYDDFKRFYKFVYHLPGKCTNEFLNQYKDKFYKQDIESVKLALSIILFNRIAIQYKNKGDWKYRLAIKEKKVCIKASYLRYYLGVHYKDILGKLIELNFIEIGNQFTIGEASKQYKIKEWLFTDKYIKENCTTDKIKWKYYQLKKKIIMRNMDDNRKHLYNHVEKIIPFIDLIGFMEYFNTKEKLYLALYYHCKTKIEFESIYYNLTLDEIKIILQKKERKLSYRDFEVQLYSMDSYNLKDKFGYRFHSPITNKCALLKDFINLDIAEIDIKNSQMFFFVNVLENTESVLNLLPEFEYQIKMIERYKQYDDIQLFIRLVKEGKIYEYIADTVLKTGKRNDGKHLAFFCLFSDSHWTYIAEKKQNMLHYFPKLVQLCDKLNDFNQKCIPKIMQRLESKLILDLICPKLYHLEHLVTIHDSFIVLKKDKDFVKSIIIDTFVENNMLVPLLK